MKTDKKEELSNVEILGLEALYNRALNEHFDYDDYKIKDDLFMSGGNANSEASANGKAIVINNEEYISHCYLQENHFPIMVTYKDDEMFEYEITYNDGFKQLNK